MRARISVIDQHTVAEQLPDVTVVLANDLGARVVVRVEQRPRVLRVEGTGDLGGSDEVAEHDGEAPASAGAGARLRAGEQAGDRRVFGIERRGGLRDRDRRRPVASIAGRDAGLEERAHRTGATVYAGHLGLPHG